MAKNKTVALFEGKRIRRHWDEEKELWHFSVVDVVGVLSGSIDLCNYWKVLKSWVKQEGSEVVTKCNQLVVLAKKFFKNIVNQGVCTSVEPIVDVSVAKIDDDRNTKQNGNQLLSKYKLWSTLFCVENV